MAEINRRSTRLERLGGCIINISLNGKITKIPDDTSVSAFVDIFIKDKRWFAVIVNGKHIKKEEFSGILLNESDKVDILIPFAGG